MNQRLHAAMLQRSHYPVGWQETKVLLTYVQDISDGAEQVSQSLMDVERRSYA